MKNPIEEMLKLVQGHEMRIDYNFNSILQLSMLVEYLYEQLEASDVKINMEGFDDFQKAKVKEIEENYEKVKSDPELQKEILQKLDPDLNLSDD
tara:strand:- start:323 stop:604 length:282 start_codon:yes stop_codon:yes gene_type:complete